jgi:hypothetical protein
MVNSIIGNKNTFVITKYILTYTVIGPVGFSPSDEGNLKVLMLEVFGSPYLRGITGKYYILYKYNIK